MTHAAAQRDGIANSPIDEILVHRRVTSLPTPPVYVSSGYSSTHSILLKERHREIKSSLPEKTWQNDPGLGLI